MISVQALANTILMKSFESGITVTPMKLQKLIYFIYRDYLQNTDEPLFEEDFLTWKYGPVLSSIYYEFKSFKSNKITRFARDSQGKVFCASKKDKQLNKSITNIWEKYKNYDGISLSEITHKPESAWYKAFQNQKPTLDDEDIKNDKTE